jgi:hypothetical protein
MPNGSDTRRVAVWLVGAMSSACACLFLTCSCLGVRGWAATGQGAAPPVTDSRPKLISAAPARTAPLGGVRYILLRKARQQSTCTVKARRYCSTVIPVSW